MNNLNSFTDILGDVDEIADSQESQPLSISSEDTIDLQTNKFKGLLPVSNNAAPNITRPAKGTGQYGQFRSVDEIEEKYRDVFSYPFFNLVQSSVIEDALYSDKSMVVCAPTGSGKTVVFEMAIVQLLMEIEDKQCIDDFKIIYMAPVKALCTERLTEWYPKFTKLGLMCIEVTGDTDVDFSQLKPYRIIITTPEKWDMVTRRWREHRQLVEVIKLFLIDEVHILNDDTRGPVLEAVVSRMKTIEASAQSAHRIEQLQKQYQSDCEAPKLSASKKDTNPPKIRFVAVSATVGNPGDVAAWLGNTEKPAVYYKFGDESRPVKLKRVVEGYPCPEGTSIFKFDIILNYKLWPVIQKYHNGKPTLIFCNTRKSVALTAEMLSKEITVSFNPEQKAKLDALASTIKNKKLQMLVLRGVGCHHAGLLYEERNNIEAAFRNRDLPILITTTTLAMGVNLPAHLVIIKNTQQYVNGAYQEYSISTVLQMVGRAGRPQFDTEATAVIMTRLQDKPRYQALVGGSEPLQSYLHKRLPENLNSEAALGTVNDVAQCVQWLRSTFLYLGLPQAAPQELISKKIEELCVKAMNGLATAGLITMDEASCIVSTEAGRLMSVFYLDLETMKHIMKINGTETLERLLWVICESHELADMHLRVDERRTLNALNRNNAAATIRFPMKGKISSRQMKLNCIIQAILGCLNIPDPSLNQEAMKIMRTADRVCKCLVAYITRPALVSTQPQYYSAVLYGLILAKCVSAHLWENSPYVSRQLRGIGPTFSTLLATAGKVNFMLLEESHPRDLERIMNKGPPAGNVLRKQITLLPKYQITMDPVDEKSVTVQLVLLNQNHLSENMEHLTAGDTHKSYVVVGDSENNLLLFTFFKDKDLIGVYDGVIAHQITRKLNTEHKMFAHCISSAFVGIDAQCEYTFKNLNAAYPSTQLAENSAIRKLTSKQTTITDVFKARKRNNTPDNDISQSKEKKKRENAVIDKLKCLKESFGKTSKQMKEDLDKTTMMSNKILQDLGQLNTRTTKELLPHKSCQDVEMEFGNINASCMPIQTNVNTELSRELLPEIRCQDDEIKLVHSSCIPKQTTDANTELFDEDNLIDDDKIDRILNEIDDEIANRKYCSDLPRVDLDYNSIVDNTGSILRNNNKHLDNTTQSSITAQNKLDCTRQNYSITNDQRNIGLNKKTFKLPYNSTQKHIQKNTKSKTKYNFVGLLQNFTDEDVEPLDEPTNGFSETIKTQIGKYLEQTKSISNIGNKSLTGLIENTQESKKQEYYLTNSTDPELIKETNIAENNTHQINTNESKDRINENLKHDNKEMGESKSLPYKLEKISEHKIENNIQNVIHNINSEERIKNDATIVMEEATENLTLNNNLVNIEIMDDKLEQCKNIIEIDKQNTTECLMENDIPNNTYIVAEILEPSKSSVCTKTIIESNSFEYSDLFSTTEQREELQQIQNNTTSLMPYKVTNAAHNTCNDEIGNQNVELEQYFNRKHSNSLNPIRFRTPATIFSDNNKIQSQAIYPSYTIASEKAIPNIIQNQQDRIGLSKNQLIPTPSSDSEVKNTAKDILNNCEESNQNDTNINTRNYAYSATHINVATGVGDITVIRKIKVDLNITETIAQMREMYKKPNTEAKSENNQSESVDNKMMYNDTMNEERLSSTSGFLRQNTNTTQLKYEDNSKIEPRHTFSRMTNNQLLVAPFNKQRETPTINCSYPKNQELKCIEFKPIQKQVQSPDENLNYASQMNAQRNMSASNWHQNTKENIGFTSNNNLSHEEPNDKPQGPQKEGKKVENILQKYSKILRKDKTESLSQKPWQSKVENNFVVNTAQHGKPKKPFKISDIENLKAPLQKIIVTLPNKDGYIHRNNDITMDKSKLETPKDGLPLPPNINPEETTEYTYRTDQTIQSVQAQNLVQLQRIANNLEDLSNFTLNDNVVEELEPIEHTAVFGIDNSMFNPKTLLQCYNDNPEVFVPPPPEFCDDNGFEPQEDVENSIPMDCYDSTTWENTQEDGTENNIFQNDSEIELTPRNEIETWTLSQPGESYENILSSTVYNSRQPFTIMHTPRQYNRPLQNVSVTRQNRLGQFKFSHKKRLPKP